MTSDRQIAANRRNAGRSTGPRTGAGKQTVARNALRHGLAATAHHSPALADELDRLANALGDEHADAAQRERLLLLLKASSRCCACARPGRLYLNGCWPRPKPKAYANQVSSRMRLVSADPVKHRQSIS